MPRLATVAALLICAGCKRTAPPPPVVDAGTAFGPVTETRVDAAPPAPPSPTLVTVEDDLQLVAIGKTPRSRLIWLQEHGARVWLSGQNLDAFADGDGPLEKGTDPMSKLPYKAGVHKLEVVGHYPHLFALRTKAVTVRGESPEPTVFIYSAQAKGPGTWREAKPLPSAFWWPHAFVPFRDGVVFVTGQHDSFDNAFWQSDTPGTTATFIGPDGSVGNLGDDIESRFMAYAGSATPDMLTLIGSTAGDDGKPVGPHLLRITRDRTVHKYELQKHEFSDNYVQKAHVHEHDGRAIAFFSAPRMDAAGAIWKPNAATVLVLDAAGTSTPYALPSAGDCTLIDAQHVGTSVYAIRACGPDRINELVRTDATGKQARIAMPAVEDAGAQPCEPNELLVRDPGADLWVVAHPRVPIPQGYSRGRPLVFRRGHAQKPIELP